MRDKKQVLVQSDTATIGEIGKNLKNDPDPSNSAELSKWYKRYVIYECILVNLVGFITLFWQCDLQKLESIFIANHPFIPQKEADTLFGHFWLRADLNCEDDAARCLTKMVCGWLMIAGILQIFINFDGLRRTVFGASDWDTPRGMKVSCLLAFFLCDWYWVILMIHYRDVIGWQQIIGSAIDIALRLVFVTKPSRMFKYN